MKVLSMIQLAGLVVVVLGRKVFSFVGIQQVPSWYHSIEKNGVQMAILVYLIIPQFLSKYMVTGAFEIILRHGGGGDAETTIFSKLATGRLPQYADLVDPLVAAGLKLVQREG